MHWCPILLSVWCLGWVFSVLACLSVDATGALVLLQFISLFLSFLLTPLFLVFSLVCFLPLLWSSALRSAQVWSVLPSVPLVVLWFPACCPAGVVGLCWFCARVGAPRCLPGFVTLLAVLGWALLLPLLFALFCFGSFLCPLCFPSPAGCLVWCSGPACTLVCW